MDALADLAMVYSAVGKSEKAIAIYEKMLEIEPKFDRVRQVLLPAAEKTAITKQH